ncbi:MAG: HAMP domain-containing sensor histidine kinase [Leeuwenhoekiella sp.]
MQNRKFTYIIYFVSAVIAITLAIQVYWNFKNYEASRRQLINEVQTSIDLAADNYFIDLAEKNTIGFTGDGDFFDSVRLDTIAKQIDESSQGFEGFDSLKVENIAGLRVFRGSEVDNMDTVDNTVKFNFGENVEAFKKVFSSKNSDSTQRVKTLISRLVIAITSDTLEMNTLADYVEEQLKTKDLDIPYGLRFVSKKGQVQTYAPHIIDSLALIADSRSAYLPKKSTLQLYYSQIGKEVWKRNLLGILLSTLLVGSVIICLMILLQIINRQKQLAEIKTDLISNITHEFKTPIATIGVALEGIGNFNRENDPEKNRKYVAAGNQQLVKLNTMVEKILETATLDGDDLNLKKEEINLGEILRNLIEKHKTLAATKNFYLENNRDQLWILGDSFHLENAFNNLLDNAVKYGGEKIQISVNAVGEKITVTISDDGKTLTSAEAKQIFEKFYRVPQGNTHDVKGFGIGLYYTKKIIEKHGGHISVSVDKGTHFKIILPHG